MNAQQSVDPAISDAAAAIGEPARARMLYSLLDGHARTSTELAVVADVSPSTASVHLAKLHSARLIKVLAQGRHRYYSLEGEDVANVLEALSVLAGDSRKMFVPNTPDRLRSARTCYDHLAGAVAVALHDRFQDFGWLARDASADAGENAYRLTREGTVAFASVDIDVDAVRAQRRRFAFGCLDWSERRFHVGGAIGSAFLGTLRRRKWATQDLDSRALRITALGRREFLARFDLDVEPLISRTQS